jgi:dihydrofolate reductase
LKIIIIAAIAENGVIGKESGEMPWHVKEEFQHFKQTTFGFPVLMGRKTFETLGKPLKGRENIIISKNENVKYDFDDVKVFNSINKGIEYCKKKNCEKIFFIGGGEIYRQTILIADEMIISLMKFKADGEVHVPEISKDKWKEISREKREAFDIVKYSRINGKQN